MVVNPDNVVEKPITPRAEMDEKYIKSRRVAYLSVFAMLACAAYLIIRGDATSPEVEILNVISDLAMAAVVGWMGFSNGREAWVGRPR